MRDSFNWYGWTLRNDTLFFDSDGEEILLRPTDLLVAIDETGNEDLSDPNYPLFGLGGCAVYAGLYVDGLCHPWWDLKNQHFGGVNTPLHASQLRNPAAIPAIAEFFKSTPFFRIAALTTKDTVSNSLFDPFEAVSIMLMRQLTLVGKYAPFRRMLILFEDSERNNRKTAQVFKELRLSYEEEGQLVEIEHCYLRGGKHLCYPALEVADFVMHAAGGAVRASRHGGRYLDRKDFSAVFGEAPEFLTHFICLQEYGPRNLLDLVIE